MSERSTQAVHKHESEQDYLETILKIKKEKGSCYAVDVSRELNISKPSVTIAVNKLVAKGYLVRSEGKELIFTEEGAKIAKKILDRHRFLKTWLMTIGVSEKIAEEEACMIEHDISQGTFQKMKKAFKENYPDVSIMK